MEKASSQETLQVRMYLLFEDPLLNHLKTAKNGMLNMLASALKAGILKIVLTSSWGTTLDCKLGLTIFMGILF